MITSILIPTDFSPASWNATQFGLQLYRMNKELKLKFLHVYPLPKRNNGSQALPMMAAVRRKMDKLAKDLSDDSEENIENIVLSGDVEEKLIDFIRHNGSDLVIVGVNSNGLNNEIGKHTISIIEKSGTPVLIVPNSEVHEAIAS